MKILANIAHPHQMDIISVLKHMGADVEIGNNKVSLYTLLEKVKPDYLFLDDKTIIEKQSLLQKYSIPTISYGGVPDEIIKATNVKCILADNITTSVPTISIVNCANVINYPKMAAEYRLESDIFFALQGPLYKQLVEHILVTTSHRIKCFTGNGPLSSASIGRLDVPQLMALCSSAKVVLCEDAGLASVLILQDIAAMEVRIADWSKIDEMIKNEKLRRKYIADSKSNIRTVFDVAAEIFSAIGLKEKMEASLQQARKFI